MIYDTFIFYNELDLLEIRLNELDKIVDKFVLVEAKLTHSGLKKPLYYADNKKRFKKFANKIIHVVLDDYSDKNLLQKELLDYPPVNLEASKNENIHRNAILKGLTGAKDKDIILISDVDEIPNPSTVKKIAGKLNNKIYGFEQKMHYYYCNLESREPWIGTKVILKKNLTFPQLVRQTKDYILVANGGHHFSFLGGEASILNKIKSYSHQEYNNAKTLSRLHLYLDNYLDLFERPIRYYPTSLNSLPKYLINNRKKFAIFFKTNTAISDNKNNLIEEIVRLRKQIKALKTVEDQYIKVVRSKFFGSYLLYEKIKEKLRR